MGCVILVIVLVRFNLLCTYVLCTCWVVCFRFSFLCCGLPVVVCVLGFVDVFYGFLCCALL